VTDQSEQRIFSVFELGEGFHELGADVFGQGLFCRYGLVHFGGERGSGGLAQGDGGVVGADGGFYAISAVEA
jgi:hypothetical protein